MDETWLPTLDPTRPIYVQIVDGLVGRIARGELGAGLPLPSVRTLAQTLRVNPNTVQRAYRDLEAMGVAESHPGQGTFVRRDAGALQRVRDRAAAEIASRAVADLRALGLEPRQIERQIARALHDGEVAR